jgi:hypothetical protein
MLKRIVTTLGVVMFMIATAGTQANAQNATIRGKQNFLSHLTVFDSCTGETIPMNVNTQVSYVLSYKLGNNGVYDFSSDQAHVEISGDGTGTPSDSLYSLRSVEDVATDVAPDANGNFEFSTAGDALLVSHGSAPNLPIHLTVHLFIWHSDVLTVTIDQTTNCGG